MLVGLVSISILVATDLVILKGFMEQGPLLLAFLVLEGRVPAAILLAVTVAIRKVFEEL